MRTYHGPCYVASRSWRSGTGPGSVHLQLALQIPTWSEPQTILRESRVALMLLQRLTMQSPFSGLHPHLGGLLYRSYFRNPDAKRYQARLQ